MLRGYLTGLFARAAAHNKRNILSFVQSVKPGSLLDLGCDEGTWTIELANSSQARSVAGVEIVAERARLATEKGINVIVADLNQPIDLSGGAFDLIHANQVIEHVSDVDLFAREIMRLLSPGGTVIVSTENGSSWHNVFAAALGWQIFSLSNMSGLKAGIGNPMALLRDAPVAHKTWTHKVIFNYRGLIEFFQAHGFVDIQIKGAGYYPLPTSFANMDPRHAHFITLLARKPEARVLHAPG